MEEKDKIEKIMQIEDLNSAQFAAEIGIQGSTLSHILNGRNNPSLDVLKKILNRFRTINPEWLILDAGTMYRQEKHSQARTLFDDTTETVSKSDDYMPKISAKNDSRTDTIQKKNEPIDSKLIISGQIDNLEAINPNSVSKRVNRIIVYYSDNTFEEFKSN